MCYFRGALCEQCGESKQDFDLKISFLNMARNVDQNVPNLVGIQLHVFAD